MTVNELYNFDLAVRKLIKWKIFQFYSDFEKCISHLKKMETNNGNFPLFQHSESYTDIFKSFMVACVLSRDGRIKHKHIVKQTDAK